MWRLVKDLGKSCMSDGLVCVKQALPALSASLARGIHANSHTRIGVGRYEYNYAVCAYFCLLFSN